MELKEYQRAVIETLDTYLDHLRTNLALAAKVREANRTETDPDLLRTVPNAPQRAWEAMRREGRLPAGRRDIAYFNRKDGTGEDVPNVCFKVPTAGGKTLLAATAVSRLLGKLLEANTGFVLWIVPNEAIYSQTLERLSNREDPYRQLLDRAAAGRVKILEKSSPLDRRDVESHLCVMVLMLQSANRRSRETLRLFRDRGSIRGFFPSSDDILEHQRLLQAVPNLSAYADQDRENLGSIVQDSLGNALRVIRPVVVLDEGHRAYSQTAKETVYGFNPSFVLELSATPSAEANWLVDVHGRELADEGMIKIPINVLAKGGDDWRECLREAVDELRQLSAAAENLRANSGRYIRPIMLVQVERTGADQIDEGYIHSEHVRQLLLTLGFSEREVAVKTAEVDDLEREGGAGLLESSSPVRAIITKQALQEGWDCPFAYVLCALAASRNLNAMTQLVGRILRLPDATPTRVEPLDQSYVICHRATTRDVVSAIKAALEEEGMADLARSVVTSDDTNVISTRKVHRRELFANREMFLPVVNWVAGDDVRPLDYEQDILADIDWSEVDLGPLLERLPGPGAVTTRSQLTQIRLTGTSGDDFISTSAVPRIDDAPRFDPVFATRVLADVVSNPWQARAIVGDFVGMLAERGFTDRSLAEMSSLLIEELRRFLIAESDARAEAIFVRFVEAGQVQFQLRTDRHNWRMPGELETQLPESSRQLVRSDGRPTEKSIFAPVYEDDLNHDEAEFACYLDEASAVQWWHRNVAKSGQYAVQGWRRHRVYPDFIFAIEPSRDRNRVLVIETKGDQLEGNLDTIYKRKLLNLMTEHFRGENFPIAGELQLVVDRDTTVKCDLILMSEWKTRLANEIQEYGKRDVRPRRVAES